MRRAILAWVMACLVSTAWGQRVYRDKVEPNWFEAGKRFWYRVELPRSGREFLLVDAEKGERRVAFDHERLAEALTKLTGKKVESRALPVEEIGFDKGEILLKGKDGGWRLDPAVYAVKADAMAATGVGELVGTLRERPSRRTGEQTLIEFENRTKDLIVVYWLNTEGERQEYARVPAGEKWQSSTYDGHVWLVTDAKGDRLGVYEASRSASRAVVTGVAGVRLRDLRDALPNRPWRGRTNSPDGKHEIFVKADNLWLRSGGIEKQLSSDGKAGDGYATERAWWSPDSKRIAAIRLEAAEEHKVQMVESTPRDRLQPRVKTLDYLKPGDRIAKPRVMLFDAEAAKRIDVKDELFANPWSIERVKWAADSSEFSFVYNQRGHQALRVVGVNAATGASRAIIDETSKTFINYSGKFLCQWIGEDEILWMSERDGWNHLWMFDAKKAAVKNQVTRGEWALQRVVNVDEKGRRIWFMAGGVRPGQDPYYSHFCRVNFDGSGFVILTEGDGNHAVNWKPGEEYFVDTWSRVDRPAVNELRRSETGELVCKLEEADGSEVLEGFGGRWPERFVAKGRDGATDIYGIIVFPKDYDPAKKYPVLEQIYAGPQGFFTPKAFRNGYGNMQKFANRGMIVVQCDGMGTSGRSKAFHEVCFKDLKDAGFPDRKLWIAAAAKKHPSMDLSRVGIYGGSAGGQNAMAALLWHNDFYHVAVADCGCHDNRMDKIWWNEQWMSWPVDKSYEESSNMVNAHLLKGKLMLLVGELDTNVDPASTMQVAGAMQRARKDFELVVVVGAGHGSAETPFGSRKREEFLVRELIGRN